MGFPSEVTLNIKGKIKILLVSFYGHDPAVDKFIRTFLGGMEERNRIVGVEKFCNIGQLIKFFEKCNSKYSYNTILFVSHGKASGEPIIQEESSYIDNPISNIIQSWGFLRNCFYDALIDRLVILAICYSGKELAAKLLSKDIPQALHIMTSFEDRSLDASVGAKAIAHFLNTLVRYNLLCYTPENLRSAEREMNNKYPDTLELWLYGEDF